MLYVSQDIDYWEFEVKKLINGLPDAYVLDYSGYGSEYDEVKIVGINGGLDKL